MDNYACGVSNIKTIMTWSFNDYKKINSLPFLDGKPKGKWYIMTGWGNNTEKISSL